MATLTIERLSHDLRGIAHAEGKTWFVEGALPGEGVEAQPFAQHAQRVEATATRIIAASADRVPPACRHYGKCGGCDVQHVAHPAQVALKQQVLLDQLARIGQLTPRQVLPAIVSESWHYRRRARLACKWSSADKHLYLGLRQRHSQQVVEIDACPVLVPALQALLAPLRDCLSGWSQPRQLGHIELLVADNGVGVLLRVLAEPAECDAERLRTLAARQGVAVFLQREDKSSAEWCCGEPAALRLAVDGHELTCQPGDFVQGNAGVNHQLVGSVMAALQASSDDVVLEAFCGLGNFTAPLAAQVRQVTALDISAPMLKRARQAVAADNVEWLACDLSAFEPSTLCLPGATRLLLDPPRDGAQAFCEAVPLAGVQRVVYVSCNPSTLARDAAILATRGLALDAVQLVDMFPQTAHIEAMAVFVPAMRKPGPARQRPGLRQLKR